MEEEEIVGKMSVGFQEPFNSIKKILCKKESSPCSLRACLTGRLIEEHEADCQQGD